MSLLEQTQQLFKRALEAGLSLREIAPENDGPLNYEWLKKFAAGKIPDPGVTRVQALHDRLALLLAASAKSLSRTVSANAREKFAGVRG